MTTEATVAGQSSGPSSIWERLHGALDLTAYQPRLRDGLVWRHFTTARGEAYVIIQNPQAAAYLRLTPEDFYVFQLMDGSRSVQELVVAYMLEFHKFALQRVMQLVSELRYNGFLVDPPYFTFQQLQRRIGGRRFGAFFDTYLKIFLNRQFAIGGIDRWLDRAYRAGVWVIFTRPGLILLAFIALTGVPLLLWHLFTDRLSLIADLSLGHDLLLSYAFLLTIAITHELSHAFTVKMYGRTVRRGGAAILYGMPGLFVDTQDIWMEPRRARIAVSWAGPYSGFILAGVAGLVITLAPGASWAPIVWLFGIVALVNNAFQLMPLIQLDGYYILMDWLEIPQLRRRALAFVRYDLWPKMWRRQQFNREERIFTVFGVLAALYTVYAVFLGAIFWWVRARGVVLSALRVPNLASLLGLILIVLIVIPFVLGVGRRLIAFGKAVVWATRRATGAARERWYRERVGLLSQVPALAHLGSKQIQALAPNLREERIRAGAPVVRQGERGDRFYLIVDGQAQVLFEEVGGARAVSELGPLDYFGERALIERAPRAATVRALTNLRLLSLGAKDFRASLTHYIAADAALRVRLEEREDLDRFSLLEPLGEREKEILLSRLRSATFAANQPIIREGEPGSDFFLIRSGRVEVTRRDGPSAGVLAQTLASGDFFGEIALLWDSPRIATVRAVEQTRVWMLGKQEFKELLSQYFNLGGSLVLTAQERLLEDQMELDEVRLAPSVSVETGDPAPSFEIESTQGARVALANYRGRWVVLYFSAGLASPPAHEYWNDLRAQLPRFVEGNIAVVGIVPSPVEQARNQWPGQEPGFPTLCDPGRSVYRQYGFETGAGARGGTSADREGGTDSWLSAMSHLLSVDGDRSARAAIQEGIFLIDPSGIMRHKHVCGPSSQLPLPEELLRVALSMAN